MNDLLEAALDYADLGYKVFPLQPGTKIPATENGCKDATVDTDLIEETWKSTPYNIGIATDGLLIIDIDGKSNPWLNDEHDLATSLLDCPIVITPRLGSHRYYKQPDGKTYGNTASSIAPGVDTRGDGGYVVAPPSNLEGGGGYRWLPEHDLAPLNPPPDWLLDRLRDKPEGTSKRTVEAEPVKDPIGEGGRNDTLARMAGQMRRMGLDNHAINASLQSINVTRCKPPLAPVEVEKIAESIGRYEPDQSTVAAVENHYAQVVEGSVAKPFPQELLKPPGFLSDLIDYNLATARRQQPILALAGALSLLSVLTGQKVQDDVGTRSNLFILSVGVSGSGKEHARKVNKEMLFLAGAQDMVGPESPASASGLVNAVAAKETILLQWDEIGRLLQTLNGKYAAPHLANVSTVLMKLFTSSDSVFLGDAYADTKKNVTINQPHAVLMGTTVPKNLYENLTADAITDGFMGRLLIFESESKSPDYQIPGDADNSSLVEIVKEWVEHKGSGNLNSQNPKPAIYETTGKANQIWQDMQQKTLERERNQADGYAPLWARAIEKARKLALLHACSRGVQRIDASAANWGRQLAEHLTGKLTSIGTDWVSSSEFESNCLFVLRWLKDQPPEGRTMERLTRAARHIRKREKLEVLEHLEEIGQIAITKHATKGRPKVSLDLTSQTFFQKA